MDSAFANDLGMKADAQDVALAHCHNATVIEFGKRLGLTTYVQNNWGSYKRSRDFGFGNSREIKCGFERLGLVPESVALHRHVESAECFLPLYSVDDAIG